MKKLLTSHYFFSKPVNETQPSNCSVLKLKLRNAPLSVCSRPAHRSSPEHQAVLVPIILLETKLVVVSLILVAADILVGLGLSLLHETIRSEVFAFQQVNPSRRD